MRLGHQSYVDLLRSDTARMPAIAGRGLDAPVPACPGWTVRNVDEAEADSVLALEARMRLATT